jgi:hypothetical protein
MGAAIVIGIGAFLLYVLLRVVAGLISKDAAGWVPYFNRKIVRHASRLLPAEHRGRWLEEWEADVATFDDRPLTGTVHAILAAAGARRLARELRPVATAATSSGNVSTIAGRAAAFGSHLAQTLANLLRKLSETLARLPGPTRRVVDVSKWTLLPAAWGAGLMATMNGLAGVVGETAALVAILCLCLLAVTGVFMQRRRQRSRRASRRP